MCLARCGVSSHYSLPARPAAGSRLDSGDERDACTMMTAGHRRPIPAPPREVRSNAEGLILDEHDEYNGHYGQGLLAVVAAGLCYRAAPPRPERYVGQPRLRQDTMSVRDTQVGPFPVTRPRAPVAAVALAAGMLRLPASGGMRDRHSRHRRVSVRMARARREGWQAADCPPAWRSDFPRPDVVPGVARQAWYPAEP